MMWTLATEWPALICLFKSGGACGLKAGHRAATAGPDANKATSQRPHRTAAPPGAVKNPVLRCLGLLMVLRRL